MIGYLDYKDSEILEINSLKKDEVYKETIKQLLLHYLKNSNQDHVIYQVEDVETYFISYYGEAEGRAKLRTPWENEKSMIKSVQFGSTIRPRSMSLWFKGCSSLTDVNVSGLDLSQCESLWATFMDCTSLVNIDVSDWDWAAIPMENAEEKAGIHRQSTSAVHKIFIFIYISSLLESIIVLYLLGVVPTKRENIRK